MNVQLNLQAMQILAEQFNRTAEDISRFALASPDTEKLTQNMVDMVFMGHQMNAQVKALQSAMELLGVVVDLKA